MTDRVNILLRNLRDPRIGLALAMMLLLTDLACQPNRGKALVKRPEIIERPIQWDSTRRALSLEYLRIHHDIEAKEPLIKARMIVVHWTAAPSLESSFNTFDPVLLPGRPDLQSASSLNVSVQFLIDRDGSIYQLMPENRFGRHVIGLNYCAIGIENVGDGKEYPLTEAQFEANLALCDYLLDRYEGIQYVIGHHEYRAFKDLPIYRESDPNYFTLKSDPGDAFMQRLRGKLGKRAGAPPQ